MRLRGLALLSFAFLIAAPPTYGATFLNVSVDRLMSGADAVVVARILDGGASFIDANGLPATRWDARVLRSQKGAIAAGTRIDLVEAGGEVAGRGLLVTGMPEYRRGDTVLLFLRQRPDGRWRAHHHAQGVFRMSPQGWARETGDTRLRDSAALESLGINAWLLSGEEGGVSAPVRHGRFERRERFTMHVGGRAARFPDARHYVELAMKAWNDDAASHVYLLRGDDVTAAYAEEDGVSAVVLDATIPGSDASVVGQTSIFYSSTVTEGGEPWFEIEEADVAIRAGLLVQAKVYAEIITHELGHALGFRHSNDGTPSSTDAVMSSQISGRFGPALGDWDRQALLAVYPQTIPVCHSPVLTITGNEVEYANGADVELRAVVTTGDAQSIHWYRGLPGDVSNPLGAGETLRLEDVTDTVVFWVRAIGSCGFSDTRALQVLVEFCDAANIVTLQHPSSIRRGATATVEAFVGGETPITIEWFDADPSSGAGAIAEGKTFTTPALARTTQFWVRASNRCGTSPSQSFEIGVSSASRRRGVRPPGHSGTAAPLELTSTRRSLPVYQISPEHGRPASLVTALQ